MTAITNSTVVQMEHIAQCHAAAVGAAEAFWVALSLSYLCEPCSWTTWQPKCTYRTSRLISQKSWKQAKWVKRRRIRGGWISCGLTDSREKQERGCEAVLCDPSDSVTQIRIWVVLPNDWAQFVLYFIMRTDTSYYYQYSNFKTKNLSVFIMYIIYLSS